MSISELCIRRPVMTTLITLSFIVFGLFAYRLLAVAALPRVDFPTISVSANLPGASPESMASSVAAPLERQFSTISGITAMTSISSLGSTNITLQFDLDRNIDGAALDVQAAISGSLRRLPQDLPNPPSFRKVNPADQPVLFIALTSDTMQLSQVNDYAEQILQQQISQINGVAQVQIYGSQKYAVRVVADPEAVSARGLSFADIQKAVSSANSNQPTGTLRGTERNVTIEATGQLRNAADYGAIIISSKNAVPVKLEDIATVRTGGATANLVEANVGFVSFACKAGTLDIASVLTDSVWIAYSYQNGGPYDVVARAVNQSTLVQNVDLRIGEHFLHGRVCGKGRVVGRYDVRWRTAGLATYFGQVAPPWAFIAGRSR